MIAMSTRMLRELERVAGANSNSFLELNRYVGFMGMKVVTSEFIPKKRVPRKPLTDDMRAMVEDLIDRGEAEEQFSEHEQALIFSPNLPGNFSA